MKHLYMEHVTIMRKLLFILIATTFIAAPLVKAQDAAASPSPSPSPAASPSATPKKHKAKPSPSPAASPAATVTGKETEKVSPSPAASATPKKKKAKASPSPSPSASPMASATPKKSFLQKLTGGGSSPSPSPAASASPSKKKAAASATPAKTPAPGGGPGLVWVNTKSHLYHKQGSKWYGLTKEGKYMSEADAIKEGDKPAADSK